MQPKVFLFLASALLGVGGAVAAPEENAPTTLVSVVAAASSIIAPTIPLFPSPSCSDCHMRFWHCIDSCRSQDCYIECNCKLCGNKHCERDCGYTDCCAVANTAAPRELAAAPEVGAVAELQDIHTPDDKSLSTYCQVCSDAAIECMKIAESVTRHSSIACWIVILTPVRIVNSSATPRPAQISFAQRAVDIRASAIARMSPVAMSHQNVSKSTMLLQPAASIARPPNATANVGPICAKILPSTSAAGGISATAGLSNESSPPSPVPTAVTVWRYSKIV
ncbi:uncharacterized protein BDR25DRAFT_318739 [Lindgomyces ingoldianus]|uniref:Uncharacterized protein n=1 Tax=Lindgomyces ingoldianus TaxID=673940 RepID=A0ACB6QEH9_9PLEO|nr:uncharacterized protein BDR25DRAFT_318739 [Lindgomyces ingoldianus]KAF2465023.1 hypothetical protein BDR25DRAFT_318739 [Lindgomyces ingoldianus]